MTRTLWLAALAATLAVELPPAPSDDDLQREADSYVADRRRGGLLFLGATALTVGIVTVVRMKGRRK